MSELVNKSEVLDIWNNYWITDMTTLDAENQLRELATVELESAPQLNDNQQVVLDWLKNRYTGDADPFGVTACLFSQTPRSEIIVATLKLTKDEQAQVLKIFANWTLEQVEDL